MGLQKKRKTIFSTHYLKPKLQFLKKLSRTSKEEIVIQFTYEDRCKKTEQNQMVTDLQLLILQCFDFIMIQKEYALNSNHTWNFEC